VTIGRASTGVILVVEAVRARSTHVRHAVRAIDLGGARVVGAVLNRVDRTAAHPYGSVRLRGYPSRGNATQHADAGAAAPARTLSRVGRKI
jgi:Mrp family chromosome partitioning ATPase